MSLTSKTAKRRQKQPASEPVMPPKLAYSPDGFAEVASLGRTRVYSNIKAGKLKARKFGRRTIITHEEGVEFLRSLPLVQPKHAGEPTPSKKREAANAPPRET